MPRVGLACCLLFSDTASMGAANSTIGGEEALTPEAEEPELKEGPQLASHRLLFASSVVWFVATLGWFSIACWFVDTDSGVQYRLDLIAATFFLLGSFILVMGSLPSYRQLLELRLQAPAQPSAGCVQRLCLHNRTLLATQCFNLGMPFIIAESCAWILETPDVIYGYLLLSGALLVWPHVISWTLVSTEASLRANQGGGSSQVWQRCLSHFPCCSGSSRACCHRHLGTDMLVFTWVTVVGLVTAFVLGIGVCLALEYRAAAKGHIVAWYVWAFLAVLGVFAVGSVLMHLASYHEARRAGS